MTDRSDLELVLTRSQELGFLGPGPIGPQIDHALRFAQALPGPAPRRALDLGAGGGLPGLVLSVTWSDAEWVYLDANDRRTAFLVEAAARLGLADRVTVRRGRAEEVGHDASLRASFDLVTARSFGPPAVTAECGSPFLVVGGTLLVSEPPDQGERWDPSGLAVLGLTRGPRQFGCQVLEQTQLCPERYPRRVGVPAKRPLF